MSIRLSLLAALLSAAVAPATAHAGTAASVEPVSVEVRYSGIDLTTEAGVAQLDRRVRGAARQMCRAGDSRDLKAMSQSRRCFNEAMTNGKQQIAQAVVAAKAGQDYAQAGGGIRIHAIQ